MKIFLDANVLFSASNAHSHIHDFLYYLTDAEVMLVTSAYASEEALSNLHRKKPAWVETFYTLQEMVCIVPESGLTASVALPEKDAPILAAAMTARCDYLLTGDKKDFGRYYGKSFGSVTIVSYKLLLSELDTNRL